MKVGLIGLGRIGTYHAANLVALDEGWSDERLDRELTAYDVRHRTDEI